MLLTRASAAALIVALFLFPEVTRAIQVTETGHSGQVSGFRKSVDVPPDPFVVVPDIACSPIGVVSLTPSVGCRLGPVADVLPPAPDASGAESLRAPPVTPSPRILSFFVDR